MAMFNSYVSHYQRVSIGIPSPYLKIKDPRKTKTIVDVARISTSLGPCNWVV